MFQFLKTKKGFSLVELMIVVVIMAILVAVAVPIYNAVTTNARQKTCFDNQRQIIGAINNIMAMKGVTGVEGKTAEITFSYDENERVIVTENPSKTVADFTNNSTQFEYLDIEGAFSVLPACGDKSGVITLVLNANAASFATASVSCSIEGHKLPSTE